MNESSRTTNFNSRLEATSKILKISVDDLKTILFEMGIDEPEIGIDILDSPTTTFDDFLAAVKVKNISIPVPKLKFAWATLQPPKQEQPVVMSGGTLENLVKTIRPIGQWGDFELLEVYGRDGPTEAEEQLKKRSNGRNCIIFLDNGKVDVEQSLYMIRKARHQETPSTFMIDKKMRQVFKVGEFPLDVFFECPLHSNVLLVDGYCEECGVTYGTDMDRLAFLRLVRTNTSTDPMLYKNMDFEQLSKEFPKILIMYNELKEEGKLPSLKRRISKARENDPFRVSSHRTY